MLGQISLPSLRAFEAAGRLGSFRSAAAELNLSPSAVSHAVVKLEQSLGTELFIRDSRQIRLSPDGEALMRHAGLAFDELRRGIESITNRGAGLLRLHSAPSFAAQWLSPRLKKFHQLHPDIEVRLAASTDYARFSNDGYDVDIVYGQPRAEGIDVIPLGEEVITPLCSPEMAERITSVGDLASVVLIQSDLKLVRWSDWFRVNGAPAPHVFGARFDRSFLAIAAAADGLGVALESTRLAERELSSGRLVAPLAGVASDVRYIGHRLVYPKAGQNRRTLRLFSEWLIAELGISPGPAATHPERQAHNVGQTTSV
jgi:LysR family glycine cleavage system transcriptional activator